MQLASDVGPVPMNVGALLVLDGGADLDIQAAQNELGHRLGAIPRLRQRLVRLPWGLGRPIWVDDPTFDAAAHISGVRCASPGDRPALLEAAMTAVTTPLPPAEPLWRAVFVTGCADSRIAVVLVLHHVLADGIGGLAVVAALADSAGRTPPDGMPSRPPPTLAELLADALTTRLVGIRRAPQALARLWAARAELGLTRVELAPPCSLNAPTGPRRRIGTVSVDLAGTREVADQHSATINDVLLTAVTGAMQSALQTAGEHPPALVISVPVSARAEATTAHLGNRVGVMPVRVPLVEPARARLMQVAALTRAQKTSSRGSSAALVGPVFRLLGALHVLRWFVERQRLVNSFLTNLPGPVQRLSFTGVPVGEVLPVTVTAGNVTVAFAALSYAGTLTIVVIVDPDRVPDLTALTTALQAELDSLGVTAPAGTQPGSR